MSKSAVYMVNTTTTSVSANSSIPLGNIQRRFGCSTNGTSAGVVLNDYGYYLVNVSISYTAPAIGDVVVNLQQDGTNVAGGSASDTVATATTEINNINITAIVRVFGGNAPDTLTLKNTGIAISTSNVSMTVVKL